MADSQTTATIEWVDGVPCGWASAKSSWHFQRRLWERWGISLLFGEYSSILRAARSKGCARLVRRKRDPIVFVPFRNQLLPVVLDRRRGLITVMYPKERSRIPA